LEGETEVMEMAKMAEMADSERTLIIWNALEGDIGGMEPC
jgi:hypothetical protein